MTDRHPLALATMILGLAALDDPTFQAPVSEFKQSTRTPNFRKQREKRNKLKKITKASRKRNRKAA